MAQQPAKRGHGSMPDFIIVGAAKCGTTTLASVLQEAPDVFICPIKEPKFFTVPYRPSPMTGPGDEADYRAKPHTREAYEALFSGAPGEAIKGEASTDYLFYAACAADIRAHCGDCTIIAILREPVARLISNYTHMVREGHETLSLEDALEAEAERKAAGYQYAWLYFENGLYAARVEAFRAVFPDMKILIFEELFADPLAGYNALLGQLGSRHRFPERDAAAGVRENVTGIPRFAFLYRLATSPAAKAVLGVPMRIGPVNRLIRNLQRRFLRRTEVAPALRERLRRQYAEDVARVEAILGRSIEAWR